MNRRRSAAAEEPVFGAGRRTTAGSLLRLPAQNKSHAHPFNSKRLPAL
jgi:hypothetical protein